MKRAAFTLVELLVAIAVVAVLTALLLPALGGGRDAARTIACTSNQRQLALAWSLYAQDHDQFAMPLGSDDVEPVYWWGAVLGAMGGTPRVEHSRGYIAPYLDASLAHRSVFECPAQAWGTYRAQPQSIPQPGVPTSTYGYNGYGLCPPMTPGWKEKIGDQRWKRLADIESPCDLLVFADTLLAGTPPRNTALLDPPMLYDASGDWEENPFPTTAFRHAGVRAAGARADGSARADRADPAWIVSPEWRIGSIGAANDPHYVQDWRRWR